MLNGGYGGARYGAVRLGRVWHGGYGKVQHGKVRLVLVSLGTAVAVWHGSVRRGKVRRSKVRFGTAGNPERFYDEGGKSSLEMPRWLSSMGLDAYEYQCGNGVRVGEEKAKLIGAEAAKHGITISLIFLSSDG